MVDIPCRFEINLNGGDVFILRGVIVVVIIIIILLIIIVVQSLPLLGWWLVKGFFIDL